MTVQELIQELQIVGDDTSYDADVVVQINNGCMCQSSSKIGNKKASRSGPPDCLKTYNAATQDFISFLENKLELLEGQALRLTKPESFEEMARKERTRSSISTVREMLGYLKTQQLEKE